MDNVRATCMMCSFMADIKTGNVCDPCHNRMAMIKGRKGFANMRLNANGLYCGRCMFVVQDPKNDYITVQGKVQTYCKKCRSKAVCDNRIKRMNIGIGLAYERAKRDVEELKLQSDESELIHTPPAKRARVELTDEPSELVIDESEAIEVPTTPEAEVVEPTVEVLDLNTDPGINPQGIKPQGIPLATGIYVSGYCQHCHHHTVMVMPALIMPKMN